MTGGDQCERKNIMHNLLRYFIQQRLRLKQNVRYPLIHGIIKSSLLLAFLFALHSILMMHFEAMSAGDAIWLTLTTATTVGYGDLSAATTEGRIATVLLLYLGGIFILAKVVGDYFDYRMEVRDKKLKGQWSWHMKNHIVILNTPSKSGERYLERLIRQFRLSEKYADIPILLLTRQFPNGLPGFISDLGEVVHYHGDASFPRDLARACVEQARDIIILSSDEDDEVSDGRSFDILHRLHEFNIKARVLAECVDDANRARLQQAGADILIRPMRAYPEMIVRAFITPGSEKIIENMFINEGDVYRWFDVKIDHLSWAEIVTRLIAHNMGIAVGYIERDSGQLVYNPPADQLADCQALITITKNDSPHTQQDIRSQLFEDQPK